MQPNYSAVCQQLANTTLGQYFMGGGKHDKLKYAEQIVHSKT